MTAKLFWVLIKSNKTELRCICKEIVQGDSLETVVRVLCFCTLEKVVSLIGIHPSMTLDLKNVLVPKGSTS